MTDVFGGVDLPVALSGASVETTELGLADPTASKLLSFCAAVMRADCGTEWASLRPRPSGDTKGSDVVRKAYVANPERYQFDSDNLPSLFLWRTRGRQEQTSDDFRHETASFSLLWVLPPDDPRKEAKREPFAQAMMKSLGARIRDNRHPAWSDPGDADPKASTLVADDDAIVTASATATAPVTLTGGALNGVIGIGAMSPRRGISITTSAATGAYSLAAIVITYVDWLGNQVAESIALTSVNGGQTIVSAFEAASVVSIAIPSQVSTAGSIRIGVQARTGRGSSLSKATGLLSVGLTEWSPHTLSIDIVAAGGNTERTAKYFGVIATVQAVEQYRRDPLSRAWPLATPPAGLDFDVSIDGENVTRAKL